MDKQPKALNSAARKIAAELKTIAPNAGGLADLAIKMIEIQQETRAKLKEMGAEMRKIADESQKRIDALKDEGSKKIGGVEKQHDDIMERLRDAQPELKTIEFELDLKNGTYTYTEDRDMTEGNPTPEESASPKVMSDIEEMVNQLMKRVGRKEET